METVASRLMSMRVLLLCGSAGVTRAARAGVVPRGAGRQLHSMELRFGADVLGAGGVLPVAARRVGLVTNDAARLAADDRQRTRVALQRAGVPLVRLFSPEHGLPADAPDGAAVADALDPLTRLPVVSLYGDRLAPADAALHDLDCMLFDVPDVGARFYTYAWTLTHVIDACVAAAIPVVVLDRPNPAGGALAGVEGPLLEPAHCSFLGRLEIPVRHGVTLGELGLLWQRERQPDADVRVIPCENWDRRGTWHRTGLPFVPASPAIRDADAALLYAGLALFEATNVSVGRGSALSFRAVGAPWLDAGRVLDRFARRMTPGIAVMADTFTPAAGPHAGTTCRALRIDVVEPDRVRPVALGLALLADIAAVHRADFAWAGYPTAANPSGAGHLERLLGSTRVASVLVREPARVDAAFIAAAVAAPGWDARRREVLLYG
jgi:uncharacterized protein YbbC (DUF1343 family)